MSTQVQRRRGTAAENAAFTGAIGEIVYLTDTDQIAVHDGTTLGGWIFPNELDILSDYFGYGASTGTNTIALTVLSKFTAYQAGQRFSFKAQNTVTGAATINVNSKGAKTIKKKSPLTSTIVDLVAGDIIAGGMYVVRYDGTNMQLESTDGGGIVTVKQGDLNTTNGSFSVLPTTFFSAATADNGVTVTLPGGEYGFFPYTGKSGSSSFNADSFAIFQAKASTGSQADANRLTAFFKGTTSGPTMTGTQRYVNASPPYDIGDGEIAGFLFLKLDNDDKIIGHYLADSPPWAYNGPTKITPTHVCRVTGKKFRKCFKKQTIEQIMDGAELEEDLIEITQEVQNADMPLIPQPFDESDIDRVVLINPYDERVRKLIEIQNNGGVSEVLEIITKNYLKTDTEITDMLTPPGVKMTRMKYR